MGDSLVQKQGRMGRQWIVALGLGQHHRPNNPFHAFCRARDVEATVRAGVPNGFVLEEELRAAFEQSTGAQPQQQQKQGKKGAKTTTAGAKQGESKKRARAVATPTDADANAVTRSGKSFRQ